MTEQNIDVTPTSVQMDNAFKVLAIATLKQNNKSLTDETIDSESARLERCVEYHYKKDTLDRHYENFASEFLMDNYKEIVFGTAFSGAFLDDVPDVDFKYPEWDDERVLPEFVRKLVEDEENEDD